MKAYSNFTEEELLEVAKKALRKVLIVLDRLNERGKFTGDSGLEIYLDYLVQQYQGDYEHEQ